MELDFPLIYGMYAVEIGKSNSDSTFPGDIYTLKNMGTGVIEAETSSLPRAIISAIESNAAVSNLIKKGVTTDDELETLGAELTSLDPPDSA